MKATYAKYLTLAALLIACACAFVACKTEVDTLPEEAISFRSHATDTTEASASRAVQTAASQRVSLCCRQQIHKGSQPRYLPPIIRRRRKKHIFSGNY